MKTYGCMKRLSDIAIAALALPIIGALVMLPIAVAIVLTSPGPVFFRQSRLGRGGTTFSMYKFRTMAVDAPDVRNADGSTYSGSDDPRVTRVGRFLRRTSLDELPQLFNVLRGDMSLVGPRPDLVDQLRYYTEDDRRKLLVRPGMTGLAQVSGRNVLSWEQRRALDLEYVDRLSLTLDIAILARTIWGVLGAHGVNQSGGDVIDG